MTSHSDGHRWILAPCRDGGTVHPDGPGDGLQAERKYLKYDEQTNQKSPLFCLPIFLIIFSNKSDKSSHY